MSDDLVSAVYDGSEAPMWRVLKRHGLPTSEPQASQAIGRLGADELMVLRTEIEAERQTLRPLSDEEAQEYRDRQMADEERRADEVAERKRLATEIREQFGDTLLARKMAAQVGVDLDRD